MLPATCRARTPPCENTAAGGEAGAFARLGWLTSVSPTSAGVAGSLLAATLDGYAAEAPPSARWVEAIGHCCRLGVVYMDLVHARRWGTASPAPGHAEWFARKRERMRGPVEWRL
jgi:hypothetical protein